MSHRSVRTYRLAEGLLLLAIVASGYRSCVLDRSGDPDRGFVPAALAIILAIVLIGVVVAHVLSASRRAHPSPSSEYAMDVADGAAIVSVISGALAWLPVLPLAPPLICAGAAAVSGLVAWRELGPLAARTREKTLASIGIAAGVANLMLRALVALRP